jgi:signal transduction protein with GAF and PtsI domain
MNVFLTLPLVARDESLGVLVVRERLRPNYL